MIYGNKEGIRDSLLAKLETLYDIEIPAEVFAPAELLDVLAAFTCAINREISIYVSRSGEVLDITIGGVSSVELKDMHLRRNTKRLSMVRCIHTHPGGNPQLSDVDISSLRAMRFDAMAAVGAKDGHATGIQAAFLGEYVGGMNRVHLTEVAPVYKLPQRAWMDAIERADSEVLIGAPNTTKEDQERAFLVGLDSDESLLELARLAETAGAQVIGTMLQRKTRPDTATYIGSGKADELSLACQAREADVVIFDDELSGVQTRNLEEILHGAKVIDRTTLILDIFAQRAQSREGRLQVELAQMAYQLPRLLGHGVAMSRLGGGIGTRGPGEKKLEMDRRLIHERIGQLKSELEDVKRHREVTRKQRDRKYTLSAAIVGYTNAGKSTLLNTLTGAGILAQDKLFATLDPTTRGLKLASGQEILLTDTVGFIRKLPHHLIEAFKSTLEEARYSDIVLHVVDASNPQMDTQMYVVYDTLRQLEIGDKTVVTVFNKMDQVEQPETLKDLHSDYQVQISAKTGAGLDELKDILEMILRNRKIYLEKVFSYQEAGRIQTIRKYGQLLKEEYREDGIYVEAYVPTELYAGLMR